jgi:dihydroxy-acid dehydratase
MVWGGYRAGKYTAEEIGEMENIVCPSPGACGVMGTANTMQCLSEAVGMSLPHSATTPAVYSRKYHFAKQAGRQVVKLLRQGITARDIMTKDALENMVRVYMAIGGSTNALLHILALSYELNLLDEINLDTIDEMSRKTPWLVDVKPSGMYTVVDLDEAGGIPAVMRELGDLIHTDCLTVTGETVGENLREETIHRREVIRSRKEPLYVEGGVFVLHGNLCKSAITRASAIPKKLWSFEGPAKVFDSREDALRAILKRGTIEKGDVIVIRYEGPRGGPGLTEVLPVLSALVGMGLDVAVVTDGKFSGFTRGLGVCQLTPEAALGGPLAVVKDDDIIEIDIGKRLLNVNLLDDEIKDRLKHWKPLKPKARRGLLALYAQFANPASMGSTLPTNLDAAYSVMPDK